MICGHSFRANKFRLYGKSSAPYPKFCSQFFFPDRQIANFNGVIDVHIGGPLL